MKRKRKRVETLSAFVRRTRKEKGLSLGDVSKQSARFGRRIAASYVNRIETDPKRKVTAHRLKALAHGLGVPVEELLARATGTVASGGRSSMELELLARFRQLSPRRKKDVLMVVEMWHSDLNRGGSLH